MKILIEGCTAEELAVEAPYLSLGREYNAVKVIGDYFTIFCDEGEEVRDHMKHAIHLPDGARWVEVTK